MCFAHRAGKLYSKQIKHTWDTAGTPMFFHTGSCLPVDLGGGVGSSDLKKIKISTCGRFPFFGLPALKSRITTHSTSASCRPRCVVSHPRSVNTAPGSMNGVLMLSWLANWGGEG